MFKVLDKNRIERIKEGYLPVVLYLYSKNSVMGHALVVPIHDWVHVVRLNSNPGWHWHCKKDSTSKIDSSKK